MIGCSLTERLREHLRRGDVAVLDEARAQHATDEPRRIGVEPSARSVHVNRGAVNRLDTPGTGNVLDLQISTLEPGARQPG